MAATLVIGAGGLLGRRVREATGGMAPARSVRWQHHEAALADLAESVAIAARSDGGRLKVAWCAGAGFVGASDEAMRRETSLLEHLLNELTAHDVDIASLAFASSAGGVYAGSPEPLIDEHCDVAPVADYGRWKLKQEDVVRRWSEATSTPTVIARISNLYGPGQNLGKAQGLLSRLVRSSLLREPISIFVDLDTRRDYLYAPDAGQIMRHLLDQAAAGGFGNGPVTRIVASGRSITVGELVNEIGRVRRRKVPAIFARNEFTDLQPRSLVFESQHADPVRRTPLTVGVGAVVAEQMRLLQRGQLV